MCCSSASLGICTVAMLGSSRDGFAVYTVPFSRTVLSPLLARCTGIRRTKTTVGRTMPQGLQKDTMAPFVWNFFLKPHPKIPVLHANSHPCPSGSVLSVPDTLGFNASVSEKERKPLLPQVTWRKLHKNFTYPQLIVPLGFILRKPG